MYVMVRFITLDPDAIKFQLPEMEGYVAENPSQAGTLTHPESSYILELALYEAIRRRRTTVIF